jgi:protein SCO1
VPASGRHGDGAARPPGGRDRFAYPRGVLRVHLAIVTAALCALAALVGVLLAGASGGSGAAAEIPRDGWAGAARPAAAGVPGFRLTDQDGRTVTRAALSGRPAVFAFLYSHCRDTCPSEVQTIRGAMDELGRDLPVYGISVDPANDTPRSAQAFLLEQKMKGRMEFLVGGRSQLAPLWRAFGIQPQRHGREHSAWVVLVDARGRQRVGFPFAQLTEAGLAHDLARLTRSSRRSR